MNDLGDAIAAGMMASIALIVISTAATTAFLILGVPWLWHLLKPWLHHITG